MKKELVKPELTKCYLYKYKDQIVPGYLTKITQWGPNYTYYQFKVTHVNKFGTYSISKVSFRDLKRIKAELSSKEYNDIKEDIIKKHSYGTYRG